MSIISKLFEGKISVAEALKEAEAWFVKTEQTSPVLQQIGIVGGVAVTVAGTSLGALVATGASALEQWFNATSMSLLGSGNQLTPAVDTAITTWEKAAIAAIQTEAAKIRAGLSPVTTANISPPTPQG